MAGTAGLIPISREDSNWAFLALLRMALATIVVTSHVGLINNASSLERIRNLGPLAAVMGFFMVSGYSIGHSYATRPAGFARRRFWRIYPTFFVALGLSTAPFLIAGRIISLPHFTAVFPSNLDFVLNWIPLESVIVAPISTNGPLWSLGLEVCFYAAAPLVALLESVWIAVIICASALVYALGPRINFFRYEDVASVFNLAAVAWAWLIGWMIYTNPGKRNLTAVLALLSAICMASNNRYGGFLSVLTVSGTAFVLGGQRFLPELRGRMRSLATWLGDLSYPLYVVHFPIFILAWVILATTSWPLLLALAVGISALVLKVVDRPLRRGLGGGFRGPNRLPRANSSQTSP